MGLQYVQRTTAAQLSLSLHKLHAFNISIIRLQCVQIAEATLHTLHAYNTSMIGLQCVQKATATQLCAHIACQAYNISMIGLQCVQMAKDSTIDLCTHCMPIINMIGLQCVQIATATQPFALCMHCMPLCKVCILAQGHLDGDRALFSYFN